MATSLRNSVTMRLADAELPVADEAHRELVRRIDWRFLLPDPRPLHVAILGTDAGSLLQAWGALGIAVTRLETGEEREFDLVMLRGAPASAAHVARTALRSGGTIYWEIESRAGLGWNRAASLARRVADLGFADVALHWHRPSFERCLEIVPLQAPAVVECVLRPRTQDAMSRLKRAAARAAWRAGLLPRLVPCVSLLARREDAAR
jgi:hypothetical protein